MLSISDNSDRIDPFGLGPVSVGTLNKVIHRLLKEWQHHRTCQGPSQTDSPVEPSTAVAQHSGGPTLCSNAKRTSGSRQKRGKARGDDGCDDDGDDDDEVPSRPPRKQRHHESDARLFACPFWKKKPRRHRACFGNRLTRVRDVKQHLARRHTPKFYCQRCHLIFETQTSRDTHVMASEPCSPDQHGELDGISIEQTLDLRVRSERGRTEAEQWFAIWDILFPGVQRPDSPYMEYEQSPEFVDFATFFQGRGRIVLAEELVSAGLLGPLAPASDEYQTLLNALHRGLDLIFEEFRIGSVAEPATALTPQFGARRNSSTDSTHPGTLSGSSEPPEISTNGSLGSQVGSYLSETEALSGLGAPRTPQQPMFAQGSMARRSTNYAEGPETLQHMSGLANMGHVPMNEGIPWTGNETLMSDPSQDGLDFDEFLAESDLNPDGSPTGLGCAYLPNYDAAGPFPNNW